MMNILIIDDDRECIALVKSAVQQACKDKQIPVSITSILSPYKPTEENRYLNSDVILLDIDMPDISGIELASRINALKGRAEKPYIIFVTSMDGLVFEALRQQPYSFVRKDHLGDLAPCLAKLNERLSSDTYTVKVGRDMVTLFIRDIVYLEKQGNYTVFHTVGGEYRERAGLDEKYADLKSCGFLRPHIGYLVNAAYIGELTQDNIRLSTGAQIPVGRRYQKELKRDFYEWMVSRK